MIYLCLLHYPMTNRQGDTVTTSVTNMDLHDISRSCRTFGIERYFVVTPLEDQHTVVGRILTYWQGENPKKWHPDRWEALDRVRLKLDFQSVKDAIREQTGQEPEVVLTDARDAPGVWSYAEYRQVLQERERGKRPQKPTVLVFGTGWGVSPEFHPEVHIRLAPIYGKIYGKDGPGDYNHLSVRSAVAIILDRLLSP